MAGVSLFKQAAIAQELPIEGGWQHVPGEKHVPIVKASRSGEWLHIEVKVKHPQTAVHHISSIRIYNNARIELASQRMHPEWSEPLALFATKAGPKDTFYAVSDCNLHGLWFCRFTA